MSGELDALDDELLKVIAKIKGHPVQKAVPQPVSVIYPVSAPKIAAWLKAEKFACENPVPGQQMPDGTIYVGKYSPIDRGGNSLSQQFKVFAAPQDLPQTMSYVDTVKHISGLKDLNGYGGADYKNDMELYTALKKGDYDGRWIIPTVDILYGHDTDRKATTPDNMRDNKNTGALRDTFSMARREIGDGGIYSFPACYWTCSSGGGHANLAYFVSFFDGSFASKDEKNKFLLSCRPVRLVPCK